MLITLMSVQREATIVSEDSKLNNYMVGILRIVYGFYFLYTFIDKAFGAGYPTPRSKSWINGNSPTYGFLHFNSGTFKDIFNPMADSVLVQWLFMMGLLGIGLALILGIGTRIAGYSGALMMSLMYLASLPFAMLGDAHNPIIDDHILYLVVFLFVATYRNVGNHLGFGAKWQNLEIVKKYPILI